MSLLLIAFVGNVFAESSLLHPANLGRLTGSVATSLVLPASYERTLQACWQSGCLQCVWSNPWTCMYGECEPGYYYINGYCNSCAAGCTSCTSYNTCAECGRTGYYGNGDGGCTKCDASCVACSSATQCSECAGGYYHQGTGCSACVSPCSECTSESVCTECVFGQYWTGSQCAACTAPCADCSGSGTACSACDTGYVLVGSQCLAISAIHTGIDTTDSSLAAWWAFESASNLGLDSSNHGNTLTNSGVTQASGPFGGAASFTGSAYFSWNGGSGVPTGVPTGNSDLTVALRFRVLTSQQPHSVLSPTWQLLTFLSWGVTNYNYDLTTNIFYVDGNNILWDVFWGGSFVTPYWESSFATTDYWDQQWHWLALTLQVQNGNMVGTWYADNQILYQFSPGYNDRNVQAANFLVGQMQASMGQGLGCCGQANVYQFVGQMDDIAIWNRALSAEEIFAAYATTAISTGPIPASYSPTVSESGVNEPSSPPSAPASAAASASSTSAASASSTAAASPAASAPASISPSTSAAPLVVKWAASPIELANGDVSTITAMLQNAVPAPLPITAKFTFAGPANTDYSVSSHSCVIPAQASSCSITVTSLYTGSSETLTVYPASAVSASGSYSFLPYSGGIHLYNVIPSSTPAASTTRSKTATATPTSTTTPTSAPSTSRTGTVSHTPGVTRTKSPTSTRTPSKSASESRSFSASKTPTNTPTANAIVDVAVSASTIAPGGSAQLIATLTTGPLTVPVTISFTLGGSAGVARNTDYTTNPATGGLTIAAGSTTGSVTFTTVNPPPDCSGKAAGTCLIRVGLVGVTHATFSATTNMNPDFIIN